MKFSKLLAVSSMAFFMNSAAVDAAAYFDKKGFHFKPNEDISINVDGRLHLDMIKAFDNTFDNDIDIRRARLTATMKFKDDWRFRIERSFRPNKQSWKSVWAEYKGFDGLAIKLGQFSTPYSWDEIMSSNELIFIASAPPNALMPSFRKGVSVSGRYEQFSYTVALMDNPIQDSSSSDDGFSLVSRLTHYQNLNNGALLHLGGAVEYRDLDNDASVRLSSGHGVSLANKRYLRTKRVRDVESYVRLALEAAYIDGPLLLQGQYAMHDDSAKNRSDDTFSHGNYIQAALLLDKNATRKYSKSSGAVGSVVPANDNGVFEVAARISYLSLAGSGRHGGDEYNYSTGVSWYMNENIRLNSNLTYVDINGRKSQNDWVWQNRFQVYF